MVNEEDIHRLISEALADLANRIDHFRYTEEADTHDAVTYVAECAREVAHSLFPPVPKDPFAPKHAPGLWAEKIRALLREAEADGYTAGIGSDCCGCSYGDLSLYGEDESETLVWGERKR